MGDTDKSEIGAEGRKERAGGITVADIPSPADAAKAATAPLGPGSDHIGANDVAESHQFELDHLDRRGHAWRGKFRCHVLTINERVQVGITRSRLAGGLPPGSLDASTVDILEMQAHLAVVLDEWPEWAKELNKIRDVGVLEAIYAEVTGHEARFHGTDAGAGGGGAATD